MPTVLLLNGYRFFFYSNENQEPAHIHIEKADSSGKVWLDPIRVEYMFNFSPKEQKEILVIIDQYASDFIKKWNDYFTSKL
jgi:hypothetical protein